VSRSASFRCSQAFAKAQQLDRKRERGCDRPFLSESHADFRLLLVIVAIAIVVTPAVVIVQFQLVYSVPPLLKKPALLPLPPKSAMPMRLSPSSSLGSCSTDSPSRLVEAPRRNRGSRRPYCCRLLDLLH